MGKFINAKTELKKVGRWWVPDGDKMLTRKLGETNLEDVKYEKILRTTVSRGIKNKRTFIDVGANAGIWTLPMSKQFEKVISFEPDVRNMECLKLNTEGCNNITYQTEGLGEKDCISVLKQSVKNCGNSFVIPTNQLEFVDEPKNGECKIIWKREGAPDKVVEATALQIRSIDSYNYDNVDLIKIDTQGHELPIIKGALKTIKRCQPWLCFELGDKKHGAMGYTDKEMIKFISKQGYTIERKTNTDCIMRPI